MLPVESLRVFLSFQVEQVLGFECVLLKDRGVYVRERNREGDRDREGAIQVRLAQDARPGVHVTQNAQGSFSS